jgi:predicted esterase
MTRNENPVLIASAAALYMAACASGTTPDVGSDAGTATSTSTTSSGSGGSSGGSSSGAPPGDEGSGGGSGSGGGGSQGSSGASSGSSGGSSSSGSGKPSGGSEDGGSNVTGPVTTTGADPVIPAATGTCPTLTGMSGGAVTVSGTQVSIWSGTKGSTPAPILFYWHGTGSSASEVSTFMQAQLTEITQAGGLVASFSTSTSQGQDTGDAVWYTGDFAMADQILACAVQQLNINTREIYTAGCSAGGLQAGAMMFSRSDYLAAAMPNSGGEAFANEFTAENAHVPSVMTAHGGTADMVVISFAQASATLDMDVASRAASSKPPGGYAIDCNHGGGHCGIFFATPVNTSEYVNAQWQFCKDHPFGVAQDPYAAGLPSTFPSYCTVVK